MKDFTETKDRRVFKCWCELRKKLNLPTGACQEVRLLSSHRDREMEALSFLIAFQRDGSLVSEKDIPGV